MLSNIIIKDDYVRECTLSLSYKNYFNAYSNYHLLVGSKTNLYKCFITQSWMIIAVNGVVSLLHPESVYDDPKGGQLRKNLYINLLNHFQFQNEMLLFPEVGHDRKYSINIYGNPQNRIEFDHIANLYLPSTIISPHSSREKTFPLYGLFEIFE